MGAGMIGWTLFVGRRGCRGMSLGFVCRWYTRIRTPGVVSLPSGGRSIGASLSWSTGRVCICMTNPIRGACVLGGSTTRLSCQAGSLC